MVVVGLVSGPMKTLSVFSGPMKWCEAWVVTCWTGLETFPSTLSLLWGKVGWRKEVG